jgi:hypothetical protein
MFAVVLAAMLQSGSPPEAAPAGPVRSPELQAQIDAHPERLQPARWTGEPQPNPEWPTATWRASIEGEAALSCVVGISGAARVCEAVSETPVGSGFGQAALSVYPLYRWTPAMFDGEPVESRVEFRVPFHFGPTMKPDADLRAVTQAIQSDGYATGACRRFADPAIVQKWDAMQTAIQDHPTADYRFYDQVFSQGYAEGRIFASEHDGPTEARCAELRQWADERRKSAIPSLNKLDAKVLPDERAQFRPAPD